MDWDWLRKAWFPILFNVAIMGFIIYALVTPSPFPCDGPNDTRENCLNEQEWEDYYNKVLKDRKSFGSGRQFR